MTRTIALRRTFPELVDAIPVLLRHVHKQSGKLVGPHLHLRVVCCGAAHGRRRDVIPRRMVGEHHLE